MANAMGTESITALMDTLRRHRLLEPTQLDALVRSRKSDESAHTLARDLVARGWLTAYQANQLLAGRAAGLVLGTYLVLERLGEGATGQVFKARHVHMRRVVAIKVIRPELLTDGEVVARFYREIQVTSHLTHPHIVHAYDAGPVGRTHFLVMEYVEGVSLADLVQKEGPLAPDRACEYVRQAALGLQHAHEKGLVHRDIKPQNLILTQVRSSRSVAELDLSAHALSHHGIIKILDLGLARLPRSKEDPNNPLTQAGRGMMGTPDYLAPEQALDLREADIRSDLYSLGCVLYFLLTGQPPFPGGTLAQKLMKHQQAPPPPLGQKRPGLPSGLYHVVQRLLAKSPAERFQTPAELATALAPLAGAPVVPQPGIAAAALLGPSGAPPSVLERVRPWVGRLRGRRRLLLGLGAGLSLVLCVGLLLALRGGADIGEFDLAALQPLTEQWRRYRAGDDPEPLRQALLAVQREHGGSADALRAARMLRELPSPLDRWSQRPAGSDLPPEVVAVLGESVGQSWHELTCLAASPAGKFVAGGGPDGVIRVWNTETLREAATARGDGSAIQAVAWSQDGQTLAAADAGHHVRLWKMSDATLRVLTTVDLPAASVNGVALSPNGLWLAATNADGKAHIWKRTGDSLKEFKALSGPPGWANGLAFTPDSKRLMVGFASGTIECWELDAAQARRCFTLKEHQAPLRSISFSSDGKTLATSDDRKIVIWQVDEPPRVVANLTAEVRIGGVALAPGRKLLAVAVANSVQLFDTAANPPRGTAVLGGHWGAVNGLAFSPDGKTLFSGGQDRTVRKWDVTGTPREVRPRPDPTLSGIAVSLDGRTLATCSRSEPVVQLWDIDGPSARPREQLSLPSPFIGRIVFAPDGKHLAVLTASGPVIWALEGGRPRRLTLPPLSGQTANVAFAPDGRSVAFAQIASTPAVCLWRLNGKPSEGITLSTLGATMGALSFTVDGKELAAVGSSDSNIRYWNVQAVSPEAKPSLAEMGIPPTGLGFGPDGKTLLLFNGKTNKAELFDRTATPPSPFLSLGGPPIGRPYATDFSPDGRTLAAASDGAESLSLWELSSRKKLRSWSLPGPVFSVDFSSDGRHLLTLNGNGTAYIVRIAPSKFAKK